MVVVTTAGVAAAIGDTAVAGPGSVVVVVVEDVEVVVVATDASVVVVVVVVGGGAHSIVTLIPADATSSEPNLRSRVTTLPTVRVMTPVEASPSCRSIGNSNASPAMVRMSVWSCSERWWVLVDERTNAHSCPAMCDVSTWASRTVACGSPRVTVSVAIETIAAGDDANAAATVRKAAIAATAAKASLTNLPRVQTENAVPTTIETQSGAFHDSFVSLTVWEASIVNQGRRTRVRREADRKMRIDSVLRLCWFVLKGAASGGPAQVVLAD